MSSSKQTVLSYLLTLPPGKVTTYKALATKFQTHPRAIGTYMRTNKEYDVYPCYKVVAIDGGLRGFILGLDEKKRRLIADNVRIINDKVDSRDILHQL